LAILLQMNKNVKWHTTLREITSQPFWTVYSSFSSFFSLYFAASPYPCSTAQYCSYSHFWISFSSLFPLCFIAHYCLYSLSTLQLIIVPIPSLIAHSCPYSLSTLQLIIVPIPSPSYTSFSSLFLLCYKAHLISTPSFLYSLFSSLFPLVFRIPSLYSSVLPLFAIYSTVQLLIVTIPSPSYS
jgi:hypothetical protein